MIHPIFVKGDATDPQYQDNLPRIIAHIVNDEGKWGAGFVTALTKRWPKSRYFYYNWKEQPNFILGAVEFFQAQQSPVPIWIANMLAQQGTKPVFNAAESRWVPPIRLSALELALQQVAERAQELEASVHMPRIGCGLAGGTWSQVEPIILRTLSQKDVSVVVYDFERSPAPSITLGRA